MISNRFKLSALMITVMVVGCGGEAPKKDMPKVDAAKQTELDKGHAETKAKMEGGGAAPAAK